MIWGIINDYPHDFGNLRWESNPSLFVSGSSHTAGDFFSDPGAAGLTCAKSGPVKIAADVKANKEGEDVFTEGGKWAVEDSKS